MTDVNNYSDNGAHNLTAEERNVGVEGVVVQLEDLAHRHTTNSNNVDSELPESEIDKNVKAVEFVVYARRKGEPVVVGKATGFQSEGDATGINIILDQTEDGVLIGDFLMSGLAQGLSIGGVLQKSALGKLN